MCSLAVYIQQPSAHILDHLHATVCGGRWHAPRSIATATEHNSSHGQPSARAKEQLHTSTISCFRARPLVKLATVRAQAAEHVLLPASGCVCAQRWPERKAEWQATRHRPVHLLHRRERRHHARCRARAPGAQPCARHSRVQPTATERSRQLVVKRQCDRHEREQLGQEVVELRCGGRNVLAPRYGTVLGVSTPLSACGETLYELRPPHQIPEARTHGRG
mmetsp:Transcript_27907/g.70241  ORF Transcript_27907/g.70241 Transcript_27907/m.70241 type:complete len:220 (+) Transcript_27907:320-979(+)